MPICFVFVNTWLRTEELQQYPIQREWCVLPWGILSDNEKNIKVFKNELEDGFTIFLKYWLMFAAKRENPAYKEIESHTILGEIFSYKKIRN